MVIQGRIRTCCLSFTYTPIFTVSLALGKSKNERVNEVPDFRVDSLSIVYHCSTYDLLTTEARNGPNHHPIDKPKKHSNKNMKSIFY